MAGKKVITILLGSPRKGGNSEVLADAFKEGAESKGCEVRVLRLASMNLKGCLACRKCWSTGTPCVQKDDMEKVYKDIEASDVIVFATPLYYYSWPTQIKPAWDRLLPYGSPKTPRKIALKSAVLLASAGDTSESAFEGMKASFKLTCEFLRWGIAGEICVPDVYVIGDMEKKAPSRIEEARELGKKM